MADAKHPEKKTPAKSEAKPHAEPKGHAHEAKGEHKGHAHEARPAKPSAPKPKAEKKTGAEKKAAEAAKKVAPKKTEDLKIVDKATPAPVHKAHPKPNLTPQQKEALGLRRAIAGRRPWFRRQQWYEYKKLANSGWRRPTGVDSAMRRHFGYEQSVVRVGFGGPKSVRGLHPSGFREVYVEQLEDLKRIDVKTQAARVSGRLGARKLKELYKEADKLGVHVLNRRNLQ